MLVSRSDNAQFSSLAIGENQPSNRIIVLGMHRSGTSCVGELLTAMGAYFGPPDMSTSGSRENPHGLFERKDLRGLCHFILQQVRAEWWATSGFSPDLLPAETRTQIAELLAPILADLNANEPWFIKEPRLCILLPVLREQLGNVVAVCVWREPLKVAESLRTRDAIPIAFGLALWERYVRASFAAGVPAVIISYDSLIADPERTARKLLEDLSALGVTGLHMPSAQQLAAVVDPAFSRSRPRAEQADALSPSQRRLLAALETGDPSHPELLEPMPADQMSALAAFEKARRSQMKAAAYRALAEARASREAIPVRARLREIAGAFRYLPCNPARWIAWSRRGKLRRRMREHLDAFLIAFGGGFDAQWYAERYPDAAMKWDPLMHFVRYGAREGRDPTRSRPTSRYLDAVLDTRD